VLVDDRGALAVANQSAASQTQVPETMSTLEACGPARAVGKGRHAGAARQDWRVGRQPWAFALTYW
jgi:hypothetical protein